MTCSRFQIALLGSGGVGKTCILQRYMYGTFLQEYVETVEDLYSQAYDINGRQQNIDFLDTAGKLSFPAMRQLYISRARGFILVYSISNNQSFEEMKKLWEQIKITRQNILNIPVVVIGNNLDEENIRQIETFDALDWACRENLGGCFLEVSAKENKHINDIFKILFEQFGNKRSKQKEHFRLRSTSICRMDSETPILNFKKKKRFFKKSKSIACDMHNNSNVTFQDMAFDDFKEPHICRLEQQPNTCVNNCNKRGNVRTAFTTIQRKITRSVSFLGSRKNIHGTSLSSQDSLDDSKSSIEDSEIAFNVGNNLSSVNTDSSLRTLVRVPDTSEPSSINQKSFECAIS